MFLKNNGKYKRCIVWKKRDGKWVPCLKPWIKVNGEFKKAYMMPCLKPVQSRGYARILFGDKFLTSSPWSIEIWTKPTSGGYAFLFSKSIPADSTLDGPYFTFGSSSNYDKKFKITNTTTRGEYSEYLSEEIFTDPNKIYKIRIDFENSQMKVSLYNEETNAWRIIQDVTISPQFAINIYQLELRIYNALYYLKIEGLVNRVNRRAIYPMVLDIGKSKIRDLYGNTVLDASVSSGVILEEVDNE